MDIIKSIQKMKAIIVFTALLAVSLAFTIEDPFKKSDIPPPQTVPYVNLSKYVGLWYQQAEIPFFFEHGCTDSTAQYSMNSNGTVKVNNTCIRNGKTVSAIGQAVPEDNTNSKLKVSFSETFNIGAPYWIVRLASDYSYSVVSDPNYRYLWILYREPTMPQPLYNAIISSLAQDNFPVSKIQQTPYTG